jgi:hypothetical protein
MTDTKLHEGRQTRFSCVDLSVLWFKILVIKNKRPAGKTCEPSGGLLWIDQEVVTLRGL